MPGLALLLAALAACGGPRVANGASREGSDMGLDLLVQQLREESGDARNTAEGLGSAAVPVLVEHARSKSQSMRALALECLAAVGGEEADRALVGALDDESLNVRNRALRLLDRASPSAGVPRLVELVSASPHPRIRGGAALLVGRLRAEGALPAVLRQAEREADPAAKEQMLLAAARLEDGPARRSVLLRLRDTEPRVRYAALADLEYVGEKALLPEIRPLLQDPARVANVGTEPFPVWHRVCDRAVEAVVAITGEPMSFPTGNRTYTAEEIREVTLRIDRLPKRGDER